MAKSDDAQAGRAYVELFVKNSGLAKDLAETRAELAARMAEIIEEAQRLDAEERAKWEKTYGEPPPRSIDDWLMWLARLDAPGRYVTIEEAITGRWLPEKLMPYIKGYLLRLRDANAGNRGRNPEGKQPGKRRKRATKAQTSLNVQAAMVWKAAHPEQTTTEVADHVGIHRTTLHGKTEWENWCIKVEKAAHAGDGSLANLCATADRRTGEILAYHSVSDHDD